MADFYKNVRVFPEVPFIHDEGSDDEGESWEESKGSPMHVKVLNAGLPVPDAPHVREKLGEMIISAGRSSSLYQAMPPPDTASDEAMQKWHEDSQHLYGTDAPLFRYHHHPATMDVYLEGVEGHGATNTLMLGIAHNILQEHGRSLEEYLNSPRMSLSQHSAPLASSLSGTTIAATNNIRENMAPTDVNLRGATPVTAEEVKAGRKALVKVKRSQRANLGPQFKPAKQLRIPGM